MKKLNISLGLESVKHLEIERCAKLKDLAHSKLLTPFQVMSVRFPASQNYVVLHRHLYFR